MSAKVAFLGLGVMGFPMAGHLKAKGFDVTVYNRTPAKAQAWVDKHGGRSAATPAAAAKGCDFVMMCVGNDNDLLAVALGPEGALAVVWSTRMAPAFMPARAPSGPSATARRSLSLPTHIITKSQSFAAAAGVAADLPPCLSTQAWALAGVRL
jgi:D-arabinose 1-dehydrogenase-like Zn-dependent alcohol dehydrogenase